MDPGETQRGLFVVRLGGFETQHLGVGNDVVTSSVPDACAGRFGRSEQRAVVFFESAEPELHVLFGDPWLCLQMAHGWSPKSGRRRSMLAVSSSS